MSNLKTTASARSLFPDSIGFLSVALVIMMTGMTCVAGVHAANEKAIQARFEKAVPWAPGNFIAVDEVIAYEENAHFVYMAGRLSASGGPTAGDDRPSGARIHLVFLRPATLVVGLWPFDEKTHDLAKPTATHILKVPSDSGKTTQSAVCVYQSPGQRHPVRVESRKTDSDIPDIVVATKDRSFHLTLGLKDPNESRIAIDSTEGKTILADRRLPAGVLPHGTEGMRLIERWDSRYRGDSRPGWDQGTPSSHLKAAVEGGAIKSGSAIVLGCGTGTNAIFLAKKGFDVTAIDIAPTALNLAQEKEKGADVTVRWLLADVLAPPTDLQAFDFIFDRGCYHGVRRTNAKEYVEAVKQLSRPGTYILVVAGNANEERHYGPPRVTEKELRGDFSSAFDFVWLKTVRFDSLNSDQGALAWLALLQRKAPAGDAQ